MRNCTKPYFSGFFPVIFSRGSRIRQTGDAKSQRLVRQPWILYSFPWHPLLDPLPITLSVVLLTNFRTLSRTSNKINMIKDTRREKWLTEEAHVHNLEKDRLRLLKSYYLLPQTKTMQRGWGVGGGGGVSQVVHNYAGNSTFNKKVLLRECKRHTARRVASTC